MKQLLTAALALSISSPLLADPPKEVMNILREGDLKFAPSKMVPGISQAVISGNPAEPGKVYVVRNRFAPGTFSPPHFHPETRYIQVLKGTWWVGSGPKFDRDATTPVHAGGFAGQDRAALERAVGGLGAVLAHARRGVAARGIARRLRVGRGGG